MRYTEFFHSCLLPLASCLPLLGGVRGGFLLPLASCLLPLASCLLPAPCSLKPRMKVPHSIANRCMIITLLELIRFLNLLLSSFILDKSAWK
ncbi:hypothetical protein BJP36_36210 [Moorena producens JHB]|uniref:Uncharacterized protein n=1 Tax=Moorena producens (strain JHB) TaxID=1454205 RepID=A0A9Q9STV2_MOOP1|nr:hypothetical protein [Moorena producens]WAN69538.1 hypothetical protein BJP36_36210 [Moorena producens JHB]